MDLAKRTLELREPMTGHCTFKGMKFCTRGNIATLLYMRTK